MLISNLTQMKTNIFAKVQTWLSDGEMTGLTLIVSVCNYNNDEVVPLCHRKYRERERVLSTVRLGNFLAFSQSLDSAALPAGEDHLVSEQQRLVMEEGGGSPARMVSRDRRTAGDDNPHLLPPSVPGRAGGQPPGAECWPLHGLLGHPDPPAPAARIRDNSHAGGRLLDR